jgi:hypothetical protein
MNDHPRRGQRSVSDQLHPDVYGVIIGLALLFAVAAWGFADGGYADLALTVVSGLVFIAIAIPLTIFLVGRRASGDNEHAAPFRDWFSGEFETSQERIKSSRAMVEILLPIAAVAFGMAIFAIMLHVVPQGA